MNKAIKLLLYFLVWLAITVIYAFLSALCNHPRKGFWWMNYAIYIFFFIIFVFFGAYQENPIAENQLSNQPDAIKVLSFLFLWGLLGHYVLRLLFHNQTPYGKLKAYYRKLYPPKPVINKVKIISKSTEDESLKRIKSRLAPHLQELISK